jgi:hypothetical protein
MIKSKRPEEKNNRVTIFARDKQHEKELKKQYGRRHYDIVIKPDEFDVKSDISI